MLLILYVAATSQKGMKEEQANSINAAIVG